MRKVLFAFLALAAAGCSNGGGGSDASTDSPAGDVVTGGCTTDLDCPNLGDRCFFVIDGGCTVSGRTGKCIAYTEPSNCTPNVACGCDGTTITACAPDGYVDRTSMSAGACPPSDAGDDADDAADDGDAGDAGDDASSDASAE